MMDDGQILHIPETNWKTRVVLMGGVLGAALGVVSAYLYIRSAENVVGEEDAPSVPETKDAVRLGISLLGIIRTIAEWGSRTANS